MRFLPVLAILLLLPFLAHARPPAAKDDPDTAASRRHYEEGAHLYAEGKYAEAIAELRLAEAIKHSPQIDYNIALCEERLEHWEAAANAYAHYLAAWPLPKDAKAIRARIQVLKDRTHTLPPTHEAVAQPQMNFILPAEVAQPTPSPPPTTPPVAAPAPPAKVATPAPTPKPITKKWWFWTALGAGVATIAVGVGLAAGLSHQNETITPTDGTYTVRFP